MLNDVRPIAVTSVLCKTLERVLASHLNSSVARHFNSLTKVAEVQMIHCWLCLISLLNILCILKDMPEFYLWILVQLLTLWRQMSFYKDSFTKVYSDFSLRIEEFLSNWPQSVSVEKCLNCLMLVSVFLKDVLFLRYCSPYTQINLWLKISGSQPALKMLQNAIYCFKSYWTLQGHC